MLHMVSLHTMQLIKSSYLLGQVRMFRPWCTTNLIWNLPVKPSSLQSPGSQTGADERRTTSFLLIIRSPTNLSVWEYLMCVQGNSELPDNVCVCICECTCLCVRVKTLQCECNYYSWNNSKAAVTHHPLQLRANHSPPLSLWLTAICCL